MAEDDDDGADVDGDGDRDRDGDDGPSDRRRSGRTDAGRGDARTGHGSTTPDVVGDTDTPDAPDDPPAFESGADSELPADVVDEAERLTRLARGAVDRDRRSALDPAADPEASGEREAYLDRRGDLLAEFGFTARVREDGGDETLVLHPAEWIVDGTVRTDRIEDTGRAVEIRLSGAGDEDDYDAVETHNAALVERIEEERGPVHAANARAFADYMANHYVRRIEEASGEEVEEFLSEYYPRNSWPSEEQRSAVETSLVHLFEAAGAGVPAPLRRE
jgi:hypothetical protein